MLLVTHQKPDLDAIASTWLLVRFDSQHFGGSRIAFVPAGTKMSDEQAAALGYTPDQVEHTDTGMGRFDHHLPERAGKEFSATSLVYDYLVQIHPEYQTDQALKMMVDHVTDVDHFGEAFWPDANNPRYEFMLHQILDAMDATATNDDSYQVELGHRLLDFVYASMKAHVKAVAKLAEGIEWPLKSGGKAFAILTGNEEVLAVAQKAGYALVIKKDKNTGHIRIKARPDAPFDLNELYQKVLAKDQIGTWYNHPSGKMLLNGSRKNPDHVPSPLSLEEVVAMAKEIL
ncbi:hypothetical protein IJJ27_04110 [bacterium]|nr:hypothetical protein [bacterium]